MVDAFYGYQPGTWNEGRQVGSRKEGHHLVTSDLDYERGRLDLGRERADVDVIASQQERARILGRLGDSHHLVQETLLNLAAVGHQEVGKHLAVSGIVPSALHKRHGLLALSLDWRHGLLCSFGVWIEASSIRVVQNDSRDSLRMACRIGD